MIALATYNGARFLPEQLASIAAQRDVDWRLRVSDDGSVDATVDMLRGFATACPDRMQIVQGPQRGATQNFLSLVEATPADTPWLALADQDDIWHPDHLARAVTALADYPSDHPVLYCSAVRLIDETGMAFATSSPLAVKPGFGPALVENIARGHTIVINRAALHLAQKHLGTDVFAHDWWLYLLITGAGGTVIHDAQPSVDYRQHGENLIGEGRSWKHIGQVIRGKFKGHVERNLQALREADISLTPAARHLIRQFQTARQRGSALQRVAALTGLRPIRRQSWRGQLGLLGAMALARV